MSKVKKRYAVYEFGGQIVLEGTEQDINKYFGGYCHNALHDAFNKNHKEYAWYKEHRIYELEDVGEDEDASI